MESAGLNQVASDTRFRQNIKNEEYRLLLQLFYSHFRVEIGNTKCVVAVNGCTKELFICKIIKTFDYGTTHLRTQ